MMEDVNVCVGKGKEKRASTDPLTTLNSIVGRVRVQVLEERGGEVEVEVEGRGVLTAECHGDGGQSRLTPRSRVVDTWPSRPSLHPSLPTPWSPCPPSLPPVLSCCPLPVLPHCLPVLSHCLLSSITFLLSSLTVLSVTSLPSLTDIIPFPSQLLFHSSIHSFALHLPHFLQTLSFTHR